MWDGDGGNSLNTLSETTTIMMVPTYWKYRGDSLDINTHLKVTRRTEMEANIMLRLNVRLETLPPNLSIL